MNKALIEQIKKIDGVKIVEVTDDRIIVSESKKPDTVKVTTQEQWDFVTRVNGYKWSKNWFENDGGKEHYIFLKYKDCSNSSEVLKERTIVDFKTYLSEFNLKKEWEKFLIGEAEKRGFVEGIKFSSADSGFECVVYKFKYYFEENVLCNDSGGWVYYNGKWATIIPEVYCVGDRIIRFKRKHHYEGIDVYSQYVFKSKEFYINSISVGYDSILKEHKPATKKQNAKLIKAELKNGYYWDGNKMIKFK